MDFAPSEPAPQSTPCLDQCKKISTVQLVLRTRKPDLRSAFQQECFSKHSPCKPTVCSKQNTGGVLPTFLKDF